MICYKKTIILLCYIIITITYIFNSTILYKNWTDFFQDFLYKIDKKYLNSLIIHKRSL